MLIPRDIIQTHALMLPTENERLREDLIYMQQDRWRLGNTLICCGIKSLAGNQEPY